MKIWNKTSEVKPTEEKQYLCCSVYTKPYFKVLWWSNNLYEVDEYDFYDCKGKNGFYELDPLPYHYDAEVDADIYDDTDRIEEILELNKIVCEAIRKQISKKPIFSHNLSDTLSVFHCECGNAIKVSHDAGTMNNNNAPNYCSKCGCRLDWRDEDGKQRSNKKN